MTSSRNRSVSDVELGLKGPRGPLLENPDTHWLLIDHANPMSSQLGHTLKVLPCADPRIQSAPSTVPSPSFLPICSSDGRFEKVWTCITTIHRLHNSASYSSPPPLRPQKQLFQSIPARPHPDGTFYFSGPHGDPWLQTPPPNKSTPQALSSETFKSFLLQRPSGQHILCLDIELGYAIREHIIQVNSAVRAKVVQALWRPLAWDGSELVGSHVIVLWETSSQRRQ